MTDAIDGLEPLMKGTPRGGKYFRRTPTGNPKHPWRYYYTREEYERGHGANAHVAGSEASDVHRASREGGEVKLTKKQLVHELKAGTYSIISAGRNPAHPEEGKLPVDHPSFEIRHQRLRRQLQFRGFKFTEVVGHYGGAEKSFLVYHHEDAKPKGEKSLMVHHRSTSEFAAIRKLGAEYNQDSVIHSHNGKHEMHFTTGEHAGEHLKGEGHKVLPHAEDYYTNAPTKKSATKFSLNFDWEHRHPKKEALLKSGSALDSRGDNHMDAIAALNGLSKSLRKAEAGSTAAFHKYRAKHAKPGGGWEYEYEHTGTGEVTRKNPVEHFHEVMRPLHSGAPTKDKTPHPNAVAHALRGMIDHASTMKTAKAKKELAQQLDHHLDAARTHLTNMRNYHQRDRGGEHYKSPKDESRRVGGSDVNAAMTVRDHLDNAKGLIKEAGMDPEKKKASDAKKEAASTKASEKYRSKQTADAASNSALVADDHRNEMHEAKQAYTRATSDVPKGHGIPQGTRDMHGVQIAKRTHAYREHLKAHKEKFGSLPEGHKMPEEHERYAQAIAEKHGQQRLALSRTGRAADAIDALDVLSKSAGHKYISRKRNARGGYDYVYSHPSEKTITISTRVEKHEKSAEAHSHEPGMGFAGGATGYTTTHSTSDVEPHASIEHDAARVAAHKHAVSDTLKEHTKRLRPGSQPKEKPDGYEGHPNAARLRSTDASSKADHTTYTLNQGEGHGSGHGTASEHEGAARLHEKASKLKRDAGMPAYADLHDHHAEQHRKQAATLRPIGREAWEQERAGKLEPMKTEKSMDAIDALEPLAKAKYLRRTGSSGHYRYEYDYPAHVQTNEHARAWHKEQAQASRAKEMKAQAAHTRSYEKFAEQHGGGIGDTSGKDAGAYTAHGHHANWPEEAKETQRRLSRVEIGHREEREAHETMTKKRTFDLRSSQGKPGANWQGSGKATTPEQRQVEAGRAKEAPYGESDKRTEKSMSNEMIESTPALRRAFRGLDGNELMAKGLYKFGNMSANAKPIAIPDEYLVAYLDSFIEEATEHETRERMHSTDAMTMGPPPGSPSDAIAQFVFNELVSYMACNDNLLRAVKLVNASRDYVSERISSMNLLKPMASHANDHHDFMQGYMYSEDQEMGYVGKSHGPGTTLDEDALLKAVMPIRAAHRAVDGNVAHMQADDPMQALGDFHRAQRARVAAYYGEGSITFNRNAGEPLPKR